MNRITVWQCKDWCCKGRAHTDRFWMARSRDFEFYEMVSTFGTAITLTDHYVRSHK